MTGRPLDHPAQRDALPRTQPPTAGSFLLRGLVAGLVAGVVTSVVAYLVGEPSVNAAIGLEHESGEADHAMVPRSLQSTVGLLTATTVAGVTLGGLLGVVSAAALGRLGRLGVRASTLTVAAVGFVALYLLPTLAYPPNPPAVGRGDTIGIRTTLYFLVLAISLVAAVAAVLTGHRLAPRWGSWYATLAAATGYLVVTLVAVALLPEVNEVPDDYPAELLYAFRRASLITQLTLWTVLAVVLADLLHRRTARSGRRARTAGSA